MGAKVTLNPTEQVLAAVATVDVTDTAGRTISLKKPGILAQYRIVETVGGETASNVSYMSMVLPILFVAAIDGDAVEFPTTKRQLEALIQRLDDHGVDTVMRGVVEHFGKSDSEAETATLKK